MLKLSNRTVIEILVVAWVIISVGYLTHTPVDHRAHDFSSHVEYTNIIISESRLPHPYEGWETFQPPLYYLINSFIAPPSTQVEVLHHIIYIRYLSIFYGLISILVIFCFLTKIEISPFSRMLVLLFIATTPKYIFVFSTYNNDSLVTMISICLFALTYRLVSRWSRVLALLLFVLGVSGIYTKSTVFLAIGVSMLYCLKNFIKFKLPDKHHIKIIGILICSMMSIFPWAYFHNYKLTQKFFPTNFTGRNITKEFNNINHIKNLVGTLFKIPKLQTNKIDYSKEWDKPWVYPAWGEIHPSTKRYDYFAVSFITSIIGEYVFKSPKIIFIWILLFIHLIVYILALTRILKSNLTILAFWAILLSYIAQIISVLTFLTLQACSMDYRYIAWSWIAWAILYANLFISKSNFIKYFISAMFLIGILLQIYILFTVEGGFIS